MQKCDLCDGESDYYQKTSGRNLCKACFIRYIEKKINDFISLKRLVSPKDKICIGVSGGKDSLVMLLNLHYYASKFPKLPKMEVILVDEGIKRNIEEVKHSIISSIKKFSLDVNFRIISFKDRVGFRMDEVIKKIESSSVRYNACTVCAAFRRRILNDMAIELKCNKLAIGHNLDDTGQTLLQNIIRNDLKRIGKVPPHGLDVQIAALQDDQQLPFVSRIKPLVNLREKEIIDYCRFKGIDFELKDCRYSLNFPIFRRKIKNFLDKFEENNYEVKYNLLNLNYELYELLRNERNEESKFNICRSCGYPTGEKRSKCMYCFFKEKLAE